MALFNIFQVNFQALLMMGVTGYTEPMTSTTANKMELVNEVFVLFFTYHLYMFTEFMTDLVSRSYVAKSLIYFGIANVVLNLGVVILMLASMISKRGKLGWLRWKKRT
jgi:hypothetical protein